MDQVPTESCGEETKTIAAAAAATQNSEKPGQEMRWDRVRCIRDDISATTTKFTPFMKRKEEEYDENKNDDVHQVQTHTHTLTLT